MNSEKEIWKVIQDFPNYSISNMGRVRNDITNKILKVNYNKRKKANFYNLLKNGKYYNIYVSKLLGMAFIDNPNNYEIVSHIDKNSLNNDLSNLKWISYKNKYVIKDNFIIGYTSKGEEFYFDLEDYDKIKDYCWYINNLGYVVSSKTKKHKAIKLHNLIMNDFLIDHKNRNKLDNRKENLRICTNSQNNMNRGINKINNTGIIGVSKHYESKKKGTKWRAFIKINNKEIEILSSYNFKDCVIARLKAEKEYFGEFAPQRHLYKEYGI